MTTPLVNTFNVGTDLLSVNIVNNTTGQAVVLDGKKTRFESEDKDKVIESAPIDSGGLPDHRVIAAGWQGTMVVDRSSNNFGAYVAALEAAYYASGPQVYHTITATVQYPDGSGKYRVVFTNAVFHGYKPGSFEKESRVSATVSFQCQQALALP